MSLDLLIANLLSPAILFFALGIIAKLIRSELEIPKPIGQGLSLYLLIGIGYLGGVKLASTPVTGEVIAMLAIAVAGSAVVPLWVYAILRRKLNRADAAATAAAYGSVSAVTFIAACDFLDAAGIAYSGAMIAALALMESPAIITGVICYRIASQRNHQAQHEPKLGRLGMGGLLHEALTGPAVFILLGAMAIGALGGKNGYEAMAPLLVDPFKGLLALFLLDMGLAAGGRLGDLKRAGIMPIMAGIVLPLLHAALAIVIGWLVGAEPGDHLLLVVLFASASYIAVPAAMRLSIPAANPGLFIPLALAITFPFNVAVGIPLYFTIIEALN